MRTAQCRSTDAACKWEHAEEQSDDTAWKIRGYAIAGRVTEKSVFSDAVREI